MSSAYNIDEIKKSVINQILKDRPPAEQDLIPKILNELDRIDYKWDVHGTKTRYDNFVIDVIDKYHQG